MAKVTLTTLEDREAQVTLTDVSQVRIDSASVHYHLAEKFATFRYLKGHLESSVFITDFTSSEVLVEEPDFTTYLLSALTPDLSAIETLERQLLQFLLDKDFIQPGTIGS